MRTSLALLALALSGAIAHAEPRAFDQRLTPALRDRMLVDVPGGEQDAELLFLDELVLGTSPRPADAQGLRELTGRWLGRNRGAGATAAPTPVPRGFGSRYRSAANDAIVGDGRTTYTGDAIGTRRQSRDVQVQGRPTPLAPAGIANPGQLGLQDALQGMVYALYLEAEGIPATRAFALARKANGDAVVMRSGNYERFGHALELADDPVALRGYFDGLNQTLSDGRGAKGKLSYVGMYRKLLQTKATEQAAMYWARMAHGAVTYDNIGFLNVLDLEEASTVASNHTGHAPSGAGPGYGNEGPFILGRMYVGELRALMGRGARDDHERRSLLVNRSPDEAGAYWAEASSDYYLSEMETRMLHHMGMDPELARSVRRRYKAQVRDLMGVFLALAEEKGPKAQRTGPGGVAEVATPARYRMFAGLSRMFALIARQDTNPNDPGIRARVIDELTHAMAGDPDADDAAKAIDRENAEAFFETALPVMEAALKDVRGNVRIARARIFADEAARVNAPVDGLVREHVRKLTKGWSEALARGAAPDDVLAEIYGHVRAQVRHGKTSPGEVARQLRRNQLPRLADGRMRLAVHADPYFSVEELSDGQNESLRVRFAPRKGQRLTLSVADRGGKIAEDVASRATADGGVEFDVPLVDGLPGELQLQVHGDGTDQAFTFAPVGASALVDGELGVRAERLGQPRPRSKTPALRTRAMRNIGTRRPDGRPAPQAPVRLSRAR